MGASSTTRREVEAVVTDDGWTACGGCLQRVGYHLVASGPDAKVKCSRCRSWVLIAPPLRERVSRRL